MLVRLLIATAVAALLIGSIIELARVAGRDTRRPAAVQSRVKNETRTPERVWPVASETDGLSTSPVLTR